MERSYLRILYKEKTAVNLLTIRLLFLSFVIVPLYAASPAPSSLEFKHAVVRYIKHTDAHCLQHAQRHGDENVSYKKELRYLFKNYNTISTSALLSRLRAAHQEMVKIETDLTSDAFGKYEQVSSALLLICAQSFFYDARNQILNALDEIDHLIIYWRYQQHHQLRYFFSKYPHKWVMGKSQAKEIANNVVRLERKQRELYTMLGALAGHAHALTTCDINYNACYQWVNGLLAVLPYNASSEDSENVEFDVIANQLALRIKKVDSLAHDVLRHLSFAKKPSHFVEHWMAYTAVLAAAGYVAHYHINNPGVVPAAFGAAQVEAKRLFALSFAPFNKIYERIKVALSDNGNVAKKSDFSNCSEENHAVVVIKQDDVDLEVLFDQIKETGDLLEEAGKELISNISKQLAKSNTSLREDAVNIIQDAIKYAEGNWYGYNFDANALRADLQILKDSKDPEVRARVRTVITKLCKDTYYTPQGMMLWEKLNRGNLLLGTVEDYLEPLQEYTEIIDEDIINKLVPLIATEAMQIARVAESLGREGASLAQYAEAQLQHAESLSKMAEEQLQQAEKQLKDQELTLMFTALIPLMSTCALTAKAYKWITVHDYSPIRIALADVNALLIESGAQLDNHAYGKLLYLVFKLRHRADSLKDPLAHEFLADVAKLESKQYNSETKHSIVENMFNKYAFLGRIAA